MLCQRCNKNEATVHYTKIINGNIEELHLCDECAMNNKEFDFDSTFSFHKLLSGLLDNIQGETPYKKEKTLKCPFCGMDYTHFKKTGKFGCAQCYETFKPNLNPIFKSIHGHDRHIGKVPARANIQAAKMKEIQRLREQLKELVAKEEFEEAAKLRDRIKELEKDIE